MMAVCLVCCVCFLMSVVYVCLCGVRANSPESGNNDVYNMCVTRSFDAKCYNYAIFG